MRYRGTISDWNDDRGFGFIKPTDGGRGRFAHISSFRNRQRPPRVSETVTYELKTDRDGRLQATNIVYEVDARARSESARSGTFAIAVAVICLAYIGGLAYTEEKVFEITLLYFTASAVAFLTYSVDKSAAKNDEWRVSEAALHLLGTVGGWPGGLAAQRILRHKSRKISFQCTFWLTVFVNCIGLWWLVSPTGQAMLQRFLRSG